MHPAAAASARAAAIITLTAATAGALRYYLAATLLLFLRLFTRSARKVSTLRWQKHTQVLSAWAPNMQALGLCMHTARSTPPLPQTFPWHTPQPALPWEWLAAVYPKLGFQCGLA